jgi:hypothetical protein
LFGFRQVNLLIWLCCFSSIIAGCSAPIRVEWSTETEMNTAGFNLYRSEAPDGPYDVKVNVELIPASPDPLSGGKYSLVDRTARPGVTYYYRLEEVDKTGQASLHGPIRGRASPFTWPQVLILAVLAAVVVGLWVLGGRRAGRPSPPKEPELDDGHD